MKFRSRLVEGELPRKLAEAVSPEDLAAFRKLCARKWGEIGGDIETRGGRREDYAAVVLDRLAANLRSGSPDRALLDRVLAASGGQRSLAKLVARWL